MAEGRSKTTCAYAGSQALTHTENRWHVRKSFDIVE